MASIWPEDFGPLTTEHREYLRLAAIGRRVRQVHQAPSLADLVKKEPRMIETFLQAIRPEMEPGEMERP